MVIALACRNLPQRQRRTGIFWGVVGVVALRVFLTLFAAQLLRLPYLQLVAGALLLGIGIRLIASEDGAGRHVRASGRLHAAVTTVIVADLMMSVDNVIAVAGAAKGSLAPLVVGLVISIPLVVACSQVIMTLLERFPWLVIAGGGLLGYIAGEIATEDGAVKPWIDAHAPALHYVMPALGAAVVVTAGTRLARRNRSAAAR